MSLAGLPHGLQYSPSLTTRTCRYRTELVDIGLKSDRAGPLVLILSRNPTLVAWMAAKDGNAERLARYLDTSRGDSAPKPPQGLLQPMPRSNAGHPREPTARSCADTRSEQSNAHQTGHLRQLSAGNRSA